MSEELSFEQKLQRLEQIVRAMEQGDVPLDESMKLFQEGTELVRGCFKLLDEAQLKVNTILANAQGELVQEEFNHELDT